MERGGGPRNIRKTWGGCGVFEPPRHGGPEVAEKPEVHGISPYLRASVSLWFHFRRLPQAGAVGPWRRVVRCLGGFAEAHAPDRWQALAVQALRAGRDVIVDAPTGNGENLPARALVGDGAPMTGHNHIIAEHWENFHAQARPWLHEARADALPDLPPLTADQRRVINPSGLRPSRVAPPGRPTVAHAAQGLLATTANPHPRLLPTSRDIWTIVETPLAHARSYQ